MPLNRLKSELDNDKKLKKSSLAQQSYKLIETLSTKPVDQIVSFMDIKAFDQEAFKASLNDETKTLKQLGEYMWFIADKSKKDNGYGMGLQEASQLIIDYFTNKVDPKFSEKLEKDKNSKAKAIVEEGKRKAKLAKRKELSKKIDKMDLKTASLEDLKQYAEYFNLDITGTIPEEEQIGLIKQSERDQVQNIIAKYKLDESKKKVKAMGKQAGSVVAKVVKTLVKPQEVLADQPSLFDLGGK